MAMYDDTDYLGRDPYTGQVTGWHPVLGVAIGAGTSTAVAEGLQWLAGGTKFADYSEALGALAGVASGGAMYLMGHKAAGVAAVAGVVLTRGVSAVIDLFLPSPQEAVAALAGAAIQQLSGVEILHGMIDTQQLSGPGVELLSGPMNQGMSIANHFGATVF
jgi:hypothetical protein